MIRFVDLFAGIGGLRLGFEQALAELGISSQCVLSSEIDKAACETYQLNFADKPAGDIRQISNCPEFDFLLAGFPCQPFSYAGKQKGFGDTRGTLFFEIERLLRTHRPTGFLLENVRGLASHDGGRTLQTILSKLRELGYGVEWRLLNSSDYDVPQNRVRLFIVGLRDQIPSLSLESDNGAADSHVFKRTRAHDGSKLVRDVLQGDAPPSFDVSDEFRSRLFSILRRKRLSVDGLRLIDFRNGQSVHSWEMGIKGECTDREVDFMNALLKNRRRKIFGEHQDGKSLNLDQIRTFYDVFNIDEIVNSLVSKKYLKNTNGRYNLVSGNMSFEIFKVLDPDSVSITIVSSDAHKLGVFHKNRLRRLTPRECARLQGFPDSFKLHSSDSDAYRQLGNSVAVPVVRAIVSDLASGNSNVFYERQDEHFYGAEVRAALARVTELA